MKHVPLLTLLLVLFASLALAALPCRTPEESMAEAVTGLLLAQAVSAERCDAELGGTAHVTLHRKIMERFATQSSAAAAARAGWFRRAHGAEAEKHRKAADSYMRETLTTHLIITKENCAGLKAELERRVAGTWEPIRARLQRRLEAIGGEPPCKQ